VSRLLTAAPRSLPTLGFLALERASTGWRGIGDIVTGMARHG
jgi:hypothetical protein